MAAHTRTRYMILALVVSMVVLALKFWAYWLTNSAAIFSDALESIVNVAAAAFGLFAIRYGAQAPDAEHPYGHGKMEFVAAGFEGGLIGMAGVGMLYEAYRSFMGQTGELLALDVGMGFTALTLSINLGMGLLLQKQGKRLRSPSLSADGHHLLIDSWSSVGLLGGLVLVYLTGWRWLDATLAAVLACWVIWQAVSLIRQSLGGLLDESDAALVARIANLLQQHKRDTWIDVHNLRVVRHGADIHIDCHLTLPYYWDLQQVHDELKRIEHMLTEQLAEGSRLEIFIHPDPCVFEACPTCAVPDCPVRQAPLQHRAEWTPERIATNQKHAFDDAVRQYLRPAGDGRPANP